MHYTKSSEMPTTPASESFMSGSKPDENIPYFPPPPSSTFETKKTRKSSRLPKPPPPPDTTEKKPKPRPKPLPLTPLRRNSFRHQIGYSTRSRRKRLQEVHLPEIKLSPRHWALVSILLLSSLSLILGFIYADCVALPHTNKDDANSAQIPVNNITLYVRRADLKRNGEGDDALVLFSIRNQTTSSDPTPSTTQAVGALSTSSSISSDISTSTSTVTSISASTSVTSTAVPTPSSQSDLITPSDYTAYEAKRLGFDSPKNLVILFFYTATVPLLSVLHAVIEIIVLCYATNRNVSYIKAREENLDSDDDSIANLKVLALPQKHKSRRTSSISSHPYRQGRLSAIIPFLPAISLTASLLLISGWITMNVIQTHCEIPRPALASSTPTPTNKLMCPIQTRGHFMEGIHQLSVVKIASGWIAVGVYIIYAAWCARVNGLVWAAAREERRARKSQQDMEGRREEQLRRSVVRFAVSHEGVVKKSFGEVSPPLLPPAPPVPHGWYPDEKKKAVVVVDVKEAGSGFF